MKSSKKSMFAALAMAAIMLFALAGTALAAASTTGYLPYDDATCAITSFGTESGSMPLHEGEFRSVSYYRSVLSSFINSHTSATDVYAAWFFKISLDDASDTPSARAMQGTVTFTGTGTSPANFDTLADIDNLRMYIIKTNSFLGIPDDGLVRNAAFVAARATGNEGSFTATWDADFAFTKNQLYYLVVVNETASPVSNAPKITTTSLPNGVKGTAYSAQLEATGATPITWEWTGERPTGISLNSTTGAISGTLTGNAGAYAINFTAVNADGRDTKQLSITFAESDNPPAPASGDVEEAVVKNYSSIDAAAADSNIPSKDIELSGDVVYVTNTFAQGAFDSLGLYGASLGKVMPVVKGELTAQAVATARIAALKFSPVAGSEFGVTEPGKAQVMKILANGKGKLFKMISKSADIADQTAAIYDYGTSNMATAIDAAKSYDLVVYVKDAPNGFDLDNTTDGKVIDPVAILKSTGSPNGGGSGGRCDAMGLGALALLALVPVVLRRKQK